MFNLQGLFVLAVGYGDITKYPLKKYYYIIERVNFTTCIICQYILILLFLYTVSWKYKEDFTIYYVLYY